jgi:hypothetical protein
MQIEYDNSIRALRLARRVRNNEAARAALARARVAVALLALGYM